VSSLNLRRPSGRELALWALFCLLPLIVVLLATGDTWIATTTVFDGLVTSKSFRADSHSYGTMVLALQGQPYQFSATLRIVRPASGPRPESSYAAVKERQPAAVTVLDRDLPTGANPAPMGSPVPILVVEQDGQVVFRSERLFFALVLTPALLVLSVMGLVGITMDWRTLPIIESLGRSHALMAFDRVARRIAQTYVPSRHEHALTMARFAIAIVIVWLICAIAVAAYLVMASHAASSTG
jgi:hypothetical protein